MIITMFEVQVLNITYYIQTTFTLKENNDAKMKYQCLLQ